MQGGGYIISIVSVMLLGAGAWHQASKQPLTLACLILGMVASIVGMLMRYASYRKDQRDAGKA